MDNAVSIIDRFLPLIGVLLGIVVTKFSDLLLDSKGRFNQEIEIRRDEDVALIKKTTFEIMESASLYWSNNSDFEENQRLEIAVYSKMSFLSALIRELFEHNQNEMIIATDSFWKFHESCTGSEYSGSDRGPILNRIREIELFAYELVNASRSLRRNLSYEKVKRLLIWRHVC